MQRIRVILAAHGEARTAGFVENFKVGWRTLAHAAEVMRLPALLRLAICVAGALRKRLSGGPGSAHQQNTQQQARALLQALNADSGVRYEVEAAFASAPVYIQDAIRTSEDVDLQLVLSMIPTDSRLSCGVICHNVLTASAHTREMTMVLARLWDAPELIDIHCAHIAEHYPSTVPDRSSCLVLVLHGTIVRNRRGQQPDFHTGVHEKASYGEALRTALWAWSERPWQRVEIAYLNHGVGGQWSSPTLPELLARLKSEGVDHVVVYACEHLVDGGETTQLTDMLAAATIPAADRLPCLNASAPFIEFLADRVRSAAATSRTAWLCDHCPMIQSQAANLKSTKRPE